MNIAKTFAKHMDAEFLHFERVENPICTRPDLNAFVLLNQLQPEKFDIVGSAEHEEIWLAIDTNQLETVITEEHVITLIRCGVRYDTQHDCLALFV